MSPCPAWREAVYLLRCCRVADIHYQHHHHARTLRSDLHENHHHPQSSMPILTCLACCRFARLRVILTSPDILQDLDQVGLQSHFLKLKKANHVGFIVYLKYNFKLGRNDTRRLSTELTAYPRHHVLTTSQSSSFDCNLLMLGNLLLITGAPSPPPYQQW